jgi:hypothetical protein
MMLEPDLLTISLTSASDKLAKVPRPRVHVVVESSVLFGSFAKSVPSRRMAPELSIWAMLTELLLRGCLGQGQRGEFPLMRLKS